MMSHDGRIWNYFSKTQTDTPEKKQRGDQMQSLSKACISSKRFL